MDSKKENLLLQIKEMSDRIERECHVPFPKIDVALVRNNFDEKLLLLIYEHFENLRNITSRAKEANCEVKDIFTSEEECRQYFISIFFFDYIETLEFDDSSPKKYVEAIKGVPLPVEAFIKPDKEFKKNFEKTLKMKDAFYAEIVTPHIEGRNQEFVLARLISKIDVDERIVYHLDVTVHLFKEEEEVRRRRPFQLGETLPVIILLSMEMKHFATTNTAVLDTADLDLLSQASISFDLCLFKEARKYGGYAHRVHNLPRSNRIE